MIGRRKTNITITATTMSAAAGKFSTTADANNARKLNIAFNPAAMLSTADDVRDT